MALDARQKIKDTSLQLRWLDSDEEGDHEANCN
jgi:hypothetical protein